MQPFKEMSYMPIKKHGKNLKTALCKKSNKQNKSL